MSSPPSNSVNTPVFDAAFREQFETLLAWRRDVRRFRSEPVPESLLEEVLATARFAPSVGNSQPWRFVLVESTEARAAVRESFERCNAEALQDYSGSRASLYARLKLSGLDDAPVHLAVFCDGGTEAGHGLGRKTMPETLKYSVVTAIYTIWLAARARGLGMGWVSILEPDAVAQCLQVPQEWELVAYLCIGYPEEDHTDPELERHGWQSQDPEAAKLRRR